MKPLEGMVVLDFTRLLPGAAATMMLANFGAEVIKIEAPGTGDYGRGIPPLIDGEGAVFRLVNRGKKSVVLDLKDARDRQSLLRLVDRVDALVESFRPGVMNKLGLDYETLRARNARLIYVSLTGYGQSSPYAGMAGHDINYLALGGVLDLIGARGGAPAIPGVQIADLAGGAMQAVIGLLLALAARHKNGYGQWVDVSMLAGVASLLPVPMALHAALGQAPARGDAVLSGRYACYNVYQAAGGRWLAVGALEPKFWAELCRALGCPDFIPDQFAEGPRRLEIISAVADLFRTRPAEEWFERLRELDACVTPVRTVAEVLDEFGDHIVSPKLSETPGASAEGVPRLGEHTREVLAWAEGADAGYH